MEAYTSMKLNVKGNANTKEIAELIKNTFMNKAEDAIDEKNFSNFYNHMKIKKNQIVVEDSYALASWEFEYLKDALVAVAKETDCEFGFDANHYSCNCGYEAYIEAEYKDGVLTYKIIGSENMMGCCPECGEDVVYYTEYDPSKTYTCPECGEPLTEEEMFPDGVPTWEVEEIRIK